MFRCMMMMMTTMMMTIVIVIYMFFYCYKIVHLQKWQRSEIKDTVDSGVTRGGDMVECPPSEKDVRYVCMYVCMYVR